MSLVPTILEPDFSLVPIGGGIDYQPIAPDWTNVIPQKKVEPDTLASINTIAGQLGSIFDAGYSVYEKIAGRATANKQIAGETVSPEGTPTILQKTTGFYALYNENKTAVFLVGGGIVLLIVSLFIKKLR